MKTRTAQECWEKVVEYSERVLDGGSSRGQRALWDHLADSWRACAQRIENIEQGHATGLTEAAARSPRAFPDREADDGSDPGVSARS